MGEVECLARLQVLLESLLTQGRVLQERHRQRLFAQFRVLFDGLCVGRTELRANSGFAISRRGEQLANLVLLEQQRAIVRKLVLLELHGPSHLQLSEAQFVGSYQHFPALAKRQRVPQPRILPLHLLVVAPQFVELGFELSDAGAQRRFGLLELRIAIATTLALANQPELAGGEADKAPLDRRVHRARYRPRQLPQSSKVPFDTPLIGFSKYGLDGCIAQEPFPYATWNAAGHPTWNAASYSTWNATAHTTWNASAHTTWNASAHTTWNATAHTTFDATRHLSAREGACVAPGVAECGTHIRRPRTRVFPSREYEARGQHRTEHHCENDDGHPAGRLAAVAGAPQNPSHAADERTVGRGKRDA